MKLKLVRVPEWSANHIIGFYRFYFLKMLCGIGFRIPFTKIDFRLMFRWPHVPLKKQGNHANSTSRR
jgi:hypothetical protein